VPAAPPLRLDLRPSRRLIGALALAHGLAAAATIGLEGWPRYLLWALIVVSLGRSLAQALLHGAHQAVAVEVHEDGRASWRSRDGEWEEGRLGESQFVSVVFVIVEFRDARGRARRMVVMPDSLPPEDFRRLRVWLRWRRGQVSGESE
jgi:hypothetical protein